MSKPYSQDSQIFTFGVHGTINTPDNIREVVGKISTAVGKTNGPDVFNKWDNGFSWQAPKFPPYPEGSSHLGNQNTDRAKAADRLGDHVLAQIDKALANGSLDRSKPLVVNLVGFSHGGNVAIQAADDIAKGLKERGIDGAIHLTTLSTPAYKNNLLGIKNPEDPENIKRAVEAQGIKFAHTALWTKGDGVVGNQISPIGGTTGIAWGNNNFPGANNKTFDPIPANEFKKGGDYDNFFDRKFPGVANHGALQQYEPQMDRAAAYLEGRFRGLAPKPERADAGNRADAGSLDAVTLASAKKDTPSQKSLNETLPSESTNTIGKDVLANARIMTDPTGAITNPGGDKGKIGDRTSLDYTFNIDKPRPSFGESVVADLNARQLTIGDRQIENPYGDAMKKILEGVQSAQFSPEKNLDNAAALTLAWKGKFGDEILAGHGKNGNLFLSDGVGDTARMVSVNIKDTDGAAQKLVDTVIAKAQDPTPTQPQPVLAQDLGERKQSAPSLA